MKRPSVEVLSFRGCPHREDALRLVERVAAELGIEPDIHLVEVPDPEAVEHERFLGSPTIRVEGRDVEPGAEERSDYVYSCRVYRRAAGFSGTPDEGWVRDALRTP